ncbi:MAG: glucose 1-dehydrogenase [Pseudomonadota bacterium]
MTALLDGKIAIVTGAGGGIGRGIAEVFAREGARCVLAGRREEPLMETRELLHAEYGAEAIVVQADMARAADVETMVATTLDHYGRLDCAVNNAGIDGDLAPTAEYSEETFDRVIAVNLKGVWNCLRYQIPAMLKTGGGAIVNVSSALADVAQYNMSAYVASKYGVIGLTKTAALEYAPAGIRVNSLLPGVIETPMMVDMMAATPGLSEVLLQAEPIGRLGRPAEMGEAAAWLASDRASFAVGTSMTVDGGYTSK